jgi:tetratricopeptide (TPR) repeat protein
LYPSYFDAVNLIGRIYLRKGLLDKAVVLFEELLEAYPDTAAITYNGLAAAYGMKGQYDKAIEVGLKALGSDPELADTRYNLAVNYERAGLMDKSIVMYEEYLKGNPGNHKIHVYVGILCYQKGDYAKAKQHWLAAFEMSPDYQPAKEALQLLKE